MNVNKHIVIATLGLVGIGLVKTWTTPNGQTTPVIMGGIIVMMVLSVADLAGGQMSKFASAMAMLALTTGLLTEVPWNTIFQAVGVKTQ